MMLENINIFNHILKIIILKNLFVDKSNFDRLQKVNLNHVMYLIDILILIKLRG